MIGLLPSLRNCQFYPGTRRSAASSGFLRVFFSFGKFVFCTCENHNSLRDFWSFRPPFGFFLCRFVPYVRKSMIYVEMNDTENIYFTAFDNTCGTVQ